MAWYTQMLNYSIAHLRLVLQTKRLNYKNKKRLGAGWSTASGCVAVSCSSSASISALRNPNSQPCVLWSSSAHPSLASQKCVSKPRKVPRSQAFPFHSFSELLARAAASSDQTLCQSHSWLWVGGFSSSPGWGLTMWFPRVSDERKIE